MSEEVIRRSEYPPELDWVKKGTKLVYDIPCDDESHRFGERSVYYLSARMCVFCLREVAGDSREKAGMIDAETIAAIYEEYGISPDLELFWAKAECCRHGKHSFHHLRYHRSESQGWVAFRHPETREETCVLCAREQTQGLVLSPKAEKHLEYISFFDKRPKEQVVADALAGIVAEHLGVGK